MFRTVRGFLVVTPLIFLVALLAYLSTRPHAAETFVVYPFLAEILGRGLPRGPIGRFVVVAVLFFLVPYLLAGLVLFLADLGISAAVPLWRRKPREKRHEGPRGRTLVPEAFYALLAVSIVAAVVAGRALHRVAHGGELPGGVNVAPLFVAMVPFVAVFLGLAGAALATIPRSVRSAFRRGADGDGTAPSKAR